MSNPTARHVFQTGTVAKEGQLVHNFKERIFTLFCDGPDSLPHLRFEGNSEKNEVILWKGSTFSRTKNGRAGYPFCIRIDIPSVATSIPANCVDIGVIYRHDIEKMVLGFQSEQDMFVWTDALSRCFIGEHPERAISVESPESAEVRGP